VRAKPPTPKPPTSSTRALISVPQPSVSFLFGLI